MTLEEKVKKYKLVVPEGTSNEVIKVLVAQAENAAKLQADIAKKDKAIQDAADLVKKQEEALKAKESELADRVTGYGEFKYSNKAYVITCPRARKLNGEVITAQNILDNTSLQKECITSGYGIVAPKSEWVAERQKLVNLAKLNRETEVKETIKIVDSGE